MWCLYRWDAMRSPLKTFLRRRVKLFLIMYTKQIECCATGTHYSAFSGFSQTQQLFHSIAKPSQITEILFAFETVIVWISALFNKWSKGKTLQRFMSVVYASFSHTYLIKRTNSNYNISHTVTSVPGDTTQNGVLPNLPLIRNSFCFIMFQSLQALIILYANNCRKIREFMRWCYYGRGTFCTHV